MEIEYKKDVTILTFTEQRIADEEQIRDLQESLEPVIEKNQDNKLIFNFVNVKLITSLLLDLLIMVHKRICQLGGQIQVSNLDSNLRRVFETTQLTEVFDIS